MAALVLAILLFPTPAPAQEHVHFGIATGDPGGTYYPLGGLIAQLVSNKAVLGGRRIVATADIAGGSLSNARTLGRAEVDSAFVANDVLDAAWKGMNQFDKAPLANLRALGALYPEMVQLVVRAEAPVRAVPDLRKRAVSSGPPGSPRYQLLTDLLLAYGMKRSDVTDDYSAFLESLRGLREGSLAASVVTAAVPTAALAEFARIQPFRVVPLAGPEIDALAARQSFYTRASLPAGTYPGQAQAVPTLAVMVVWATHSAVPEEVVYQVVKAVYENHDILAQVHAQGRHVRAQSALTSVSVPLHPGAERYFREKGLLRP